ncbi:MAG: hypothetical protein JRH19_01965, partial [Deltaproteobacteria bacterium]|nr:hypothetical protein [Deltaproteobacteria bacterium]
MDERELQEKIEQLETRLADFELRRGARLRERLLATLASARGRTALLVAAVAIPAAAYAAAIGVPHTFSNNSPADANEVNANFDALVTESNAQNSRISSLEGDTDAHASDPSAHHAEYDYTEAAAEILAVDGSGSGLDADLLDGLDSTTFAPAGASYSKAETDALLGGYSPIAGSASIASVGTIGAGTWQGSAIDPSYLAGQSGTNTGDESAATDTAEGVVQLATDAEVNSATAMNRAVTPSSLDTLTLLTSGTLQGNVKVATLSSSQTLTTNQVRGDFFMVTAAASITLPPVDESVTGMSVCVYSTTAATVSLYPDASDRIVLDGTAAGNGDPVTSAGSAGDFICVLNGSTAGWTTLGGSGVWTAAEPVAGPVVLFTQDFEDNDTCSNLGADVRWGSPDCQYASETLSGNHSMLLAGYTNGESLSVGWPNTEFSQDCDDGNLCRVKTLIQIDSALGEGS